MDAYIANKPRVVEAIKTRNPRKPEKKITEREIIIKINIESFE